MPFESGKQLFNECNNEDKVFIKIEGGQHNNLIEFEEYLNQIEKILQ